MGTITVTDPDSGEDYAAADLTLAGTDAASFTIADSGDDVVLQHDNALDYETKTSYSITIAADDPDDSNLALGAQAFTITVTDVEITITASQTGSIAESAADDADVMTVATTGDSATTFSITAGNSDGIFKISNAGLIEIDSTTNLDYESDASYTLTIRANDGTANDDEDLTITITDVNDQTPTYSSSDTTPNVDEGDTAVETVAITDTDTGDSNTCTRAGADAALFTCTVSATQYVLAFANAEDYDAVSYTHLTLPTNREV